MNEEDLDHHQLKCIHRLVFCPRIVCGERKVLFKDVIAHLKTFYKGLMEYKPVVKGEANTFLTRKPTEELGLSNGNFWTPVQLTTSCGAVFFSIGKTVNEIVFVWIIFMGSSDEAKKFSCAISISNQIGQKFLYSGPVQTLDDNSDDIIASGSLLMIGVSAAKRSLNSKKQLEVEITIRNMKEEAKDDDMESGVSDGE